MLQEREEGDFHHHAERRSGAVEPDPVTIELIEE